MSSKQEKLSWDETFIGIVQKHPVLYDKQHKNYRKNLVKNGIWIEIAKVAKMPSERDDDELSLFVFINFTRNLDGEAARKRWNQLVRTYTANRPKRPTGSGQQEPIKWPLFETMKFIDDFTQEREG